MAAVIIDYGMGNVASVQKALNFLNIENIISNNFDTINKSKYLILPGVGSFSQGMSNLHKYGLVDLLTDQVVNLKKPFLGICLGMQLLAKKGSEPFETKGMGWIEGEVIKIDAQQKRIPHLGWNSIEVIKPKYFSDLKSLDFYFIHGYHLKVSDPTQVSSMVNYGIDIVSSVQKENIFATQFHPEKSQQAGLRLLKSFFELNA